MEQILSKLSEIELAAKAVQEEADKTKKVLSEEMEKQSKDFNAVLESKTNTRIQQIRDERHKECGNCGAEELIHLKVTHQPQHKTYNNTAKSGAEAIQKSGTEENCEAAGTQEVTNEISGHSIRSLCCVSLVDPSNSFFRTGLLGTDSAA